MRKFVVLAALFLTACSEAPKPEAKKAKEPEKPAEPVSGQSAFFLMYTSARSWMPDAKGLTLTSMAIDQVKPENGKYGAWRAVFVSESRGRARPYTYSVVESPGNVYKGVFAHHEESYTQRGQNKPFLIAALKTDTDAVLETAMKKAADYAKKFPDKPVTFLLELTPRFPNPAWRVIWGESVGTSNFSIYVDASTGEYLQTMR